MVRLKLVPIRQAAPLALMLIVFLLLPRQLFRHVLLPIIVPSVIGIALFGFTLSYDGFARTLLTAGSDNTLPSEIFGMTTTVTTPIIYAPGTLTT
jgi:putative spermidine/putrescine transport system permease protein